MTIFQWLQGSDERSISRGRWISGSADGRVSSEKADTSPGRGKAAFLEWKPAARIPFCLFQLSFGSPPSLSFVCSNFPRAPLYGQDVFFGSVPIGNLHGPWQLVIGVRLSRTRHRYPLSSSRENERRRFF